jgi:hypothetical protein
MTVPAFSPSVVLPGAPSAPAGVGAPGTGVAGDVFEGLLAGLADAGDPARPSRGRASDASPHAASSDEDATRPQDAGLALLLAAPGAAPVLTPLPQTDDATAAMSADVLAARQIRVPASGAAITPLPAAAPSPDDLMSRTSVGQVVAADAADPAPLAPSTPHIDAAFKSLPVQTGQTVPDVDVKAAPNPPPVAQAEAARAAPPPPPAIPPPATIAAAAPPAVATAAAAAAVETQPAAETPRPAPTIGDVRRAAVARGDRRADPAGRSPSMAQPAASPVKQAALAALAETIDATPTGPSASVEPEVAPADATGAPEATQPNLPAEVRAQAAQALVAADVAPVPRGSPETVAKLAADIVRKLDGQSTRFDLELNPHGMGKVDVAIEIDRAGKLTAAMTFDTAQSAADLRGRATELRQALEQAGFSVSDGGLTFDTAGQGAGFGGRDAAQQQQDRAWNGRAFQRAQSGADDADLSLTSASSLSASRPRSGVDIRI